MTLPSTVAEVGLVEFISGAFDGAGTADDGEAGSAFLFPHIGPPRSFHGSQKALAFGRGEPLYSSVSERSKKIIGGPVRDSNATLGYTATLAASEDHLIVAQQGSQETNDNRGADSGGHGVQPDADVARR